MATASCGSRGSFERSGETALPSANGAACVRVVSGAMPSLSAGSGRAILVAGDEATNEPGWVEPLEMECIIVAVAAVCIFILSPIRPFCGAHTHGHGEWAARTRGKWRCA